ncbi:site-2 protease family protein [Hydrocarboniphaga sp.]|uniref:site-2 protease family protein n=1 Tax=Hydrocarboniphaga sp. TaxID=2033016 RepID=UPI003D118DC3
MIKLLLLLLSGAKFGKLALTGGTMLLSMAVYAWIWGWPYAVGFVLMILVHEMGHYVAARQRGLNVGAPTFIPFVGAWIQLKDLPHDAETDAYIGIAGPVAGTLAAFACFEAGRYYDSGLLIALAYAGYMINLFNLLPLGPLDGGRVTAVVSPKIWLIGAPLLVGLFIWHPSPMFLLVALIAWPSFWNALRGRSGGGAYYDVPLQTRVNYGLAYLGLVAYLGAMTYSLHEQLQGMRPG